MVETKFKETLLKYISDNKLTASKFAKMVDIKASTFYDFLDSENPMLRNALKIVDYLHSSLDYFEQKTDVFECKHKQNYSVNLFDIVKKYLKEKHISYTAMCDEIGISKANLSRWKAGNEPKYNTIVNLANFFEVSIDKFVGRV